MFRRILDSIPSFGQGLLPSGHVNSGPFSQAEPDTKRLERLSEREARKDWCGGLGWVFIWPGVWFGLSVLCCFAVCLIMLIQYAFAMGFIVCWQAGNFAVLCQALICVLRCVFCCSATLKKLQSQIYSACLWFVALLRFVLL